MVANSAARRIAAVPLSISHPMLTIIATIIYFTATNVILANFWNGRFRKSFEKMEEAVGLALKSQGRESVNISDLSKEERKELQKLGKPMLKEQKQKEKNIGKEAK